MYVAVSLRVRAEGQAFRCAYALRIVDIKQSQLPVRTLLGETAEQAENACVRRNNRITVAHLLSVAGDRRPLQLSGGPFAAEEGFGDSKRCQETALLRGNDRFTPDLRGTVGKNARRNPHQLVE